MTDALVAAARRGVRVVALTPGKIDHALVRSASRHDFGRLLQSGVQIFEYQAALLHAKTLVVDGAWSSVGSTNLDNRSFTLNDELNRAVYDACVAGQLEQVFERDLQHARRVEYADWAKRSRRPDREEGPRASPLGDLLRLGGSRSATRITRGGAASGVIGGIRPERFPSPRRSSVAARGRNVPALLRLPARARPD